MSLRHPYASYAGEYDHLPAYGTTASKSDRTGKSTTAAKPATGTAKALAGMSTAQILTGLTASQTASLASALGASDEKAGTSKRNSEAEYRRGVANGRAAERTRVRKVYDESKTQGGASEALKLLATSDLDSAAIIGKLFGHDTSLVDAMRARHGLNKDSGR